MGALMMAFLVITMSMTFLSHNGNDKKDPEAIMTTRSRNLRGGGDEGNVVVGGKQHAGRDVRWTDDWYTPGLDDDCWFWRDDCLMPLEP